MDIEKRETEFAEQYLKLKASGMKPHAAFESIQKMGFLGTRRTMERHVSSVLSTGHALSLVKKDGSLPLLNDDQMSEVDAWVLGQNTNNSPIGYAEVQKFIEDTFNIKVCRMTAGNILHRLGYFFKRSKK